MRFLASSAWEITDIIKDCYETASVSYLFDSLFFFFFKRHLFIGERESTYAHELGQRQRERAFKETSSEHEPSTGLNLIIHEIIPEWDHTWPKIKSRKLNWQSHHSTPTHLIFLNSTFVTHMLWNSYIFCIHMQV